MVNDRIFLKIQITLLFSDLHQHNIHPRSRSFRNSGAGGTTFKIAKWLNLNYLAIFLSLNFCRVPYKVTYYDSI
jgi:hypothetical protein